MKKHNWFLISIACIGLLFFGCSGGGTDADNDDDGEEEETKTESTVEVDDSFAFTADPSDTEDPEVLNTIPVLGTSNVSPTAPVVMYLDDLIDPASIGDSSIKVFESSGSAVENARAAGAKQVYGTFTISKSANGLVTIIVFTPFDSFSQNVTITVTIGEGVLDKGGNPLDPQDVTVFTTGTPETTGVSALSFENGEEGLSFNGQGGIVELPKWGISAMGGTHAAAITTGDVAFFTNEPISEQYSVFSTGSVSVPSGATKLSLDYYFISDEFKEYLGTQYDDNATVTVSGPDGGKTVVLNSVNSYDSVEGEALLTEVPEIGNYGSWWTTPKTTKSIDISDLGDEVTISITISDVGDDILGSMLLFDDIRFE